MSSGKRGHQVVRIAWEYGPMGAKNLAIDAASPDDIAVGAAVLITGLADNVAGFFSEKAAIAAQALLDVLRADGKIDQLPIGVRVEGPKKPAAS